MGPVNFRSRKQAYQSADPMPQTEYLPVLLSTRYSQAAGSSWVYYRQNQQAMREVADAEDAHRTQVTLEPGRQVTQ